MTSVSKENCLLFPPYTTVHINGIGDTMPDVETEYDGSTYLIVYITIIGWSPLGTQNLVGFFHGVEINIKQTKKFG